MAIADIYIGDTRQLSLTFVESDATPVDVSNWLIFITFKTNKDDLDYESVLQKTFSLPADANSIAGLATIELTSTDTKNFTAGGTYFYDIQRVIPATSPLDVLTLEDGTVDIILGVTGVDEIHSFVPNFVGMTEANASTAITTAGFIVGTISYIVGDSGNVITQTPVFDTYYPLGDAIDLEVGI